MSIERIRDELSRIGAALHDPKTAEKDYVCLYSAQQSLLWAIDPEIAAEPFDVIVSGKVQPLG